jgi:hypothetical protein
MSRKNGTIFEGNQKSESSSQLIPDFLLLSSHELHLAAAFEGAAEGYFVGVFEVAAHG